MKHIFIIFLSVLIPQTIFAGDDFSFFGSLENRAALLNENPTPIAEHKPFPYDDLTNEEKKASWEKVRTPLELNFSDTHYVKLGAGVKWRGFDLGAYYTTLSNHNNLKDKFQDTYPLSTGPNENTHPVKNTWINPNDHGYEDYYVTGKATGTAEGDFSFQHYDVEAGAVFKIDKIAVRFSAGMRYADYNQSLNVNRTGVPFCSRRNITKKTPPEYDYACDDPDVPFNDGADPLKVLDLNAHHPAFGSIRDVDMQIEAFGPRLGLSVSAPFSKNISLIGAFNWAVLYGDREITDNYRTTKTTRIITKPGRAEVPAFVGNGTVENPETPLVPALPPVYGQTTIVDKNKEGEIRKKYEDNTVHNLELEIGLQYKLELSDNSTLSFVAGYRHDIHYGVRSIFCGSSKIQVTDPIEFAKDPKTRKKLPVPSYGNCGARQDDGSIPHGESEDFTVQGPFIRTTVTF